MHIKLLRLIYYKSAAKLQNYFYICKNLDVFFDKYLFFANGW